MSFFLIGTYISEWNGFWNEKECWAGLDFILRELIGSLEVGHWQMEADLNASLLVLYN